MTALQSREHADMTNEKMVESLWALANSVTAFAVLQALTFLYALVKKDFVDAISNRTLSSLAATSGPAMIGMTN